MPNETDETERTNRIPGPVRRRVRQTGYVALGVVGAASGVASAQAVDEASSVACGTGLGDVVRVLLGALVLLFAVVAVVRAMQGLNNRGSTQSETKMRGKEQLQGAGFSVAAVFVPLVAAGLFSYAGVPFLSCIDLGNVLVIAF